ncbi:MAG: exodeoxyribonuclease VII small subunit [Anaerolineaceae bacterium]|jgi:exodeoxyribonuclease VII small subunit|nr:exodeoxyribonuclease VII small subunit [Anaerolineaceae bacterium]
MTEKIKPVEQLSYEKAFAELEDIVNQLEGEQPPLEESLKLYERGQALTRRCADLLENAELKLQQLADRELDDADTDQDG